MPLILRAPRAEKCTIGFPESPTAMPLQLAWSKRGIWATKTTPNAPKVPPLAPGHPPLRAPAPRQEQAASTVLRVNLSRQILEVT